MKLKLSQEEVTRILCEAIAGRHGLLFNTGEINSAYNHLSFVELSFVEPAQCELPLPSEL